MTPDKIGRYLVRRVLSQHTERPVWLAYDPLLDRLVELRRLADERRLSTLRTETALDHPAIIPVFAVEEGPDGVHAATAHIEGRAVPEWLRERGRSVAEILDVFRQAGAALVAAHGQGLGHGAFGGDSVLLGWDGRVYVRGLGDEAGWTERDDARAWVAALSAALAELPAGELPDWVRRTLGSGAEGMPLKTLLRRLERDPVATRRRRLAIAGAALAVASIGLLGIKAPWRAPLCPEAIERLAGVWDAPVRGRVESAFLGSGLTEAGFAWSATAKALDAYAASWLAAHRDACLAAHVRHEQSPAQLDLRMGCLDARRRELAGLASVLAESNPETIRRAPQAVEALSPIERCADVEALSRGLRRPTNPTAQERAGRLARARALKLAGRYDDALGLARTVATDAQEGGDPALEAEADTLIGQLEVRARRTGPAEEALLRGAFQALGIGHDASFAEAAIALVSLEYEDRSRQGRASWWDTLARAALDRAGRPAELEQVLEFRHGDGELQRGHLSEAQRHFERALELTRADDSAARALAEDRLGRVHRLRDQPEQALDHQQRALSLFLAAYGPAHPNVAVALQSVALALRNADRLREALDYHRRAIGLQESTLGKAHPDRAGMDNGLAITLWELGDAAGAYPLFNSALATYTAHFGEKHTTVANIKGNLAQVLSRLGRAREAQVMAEDALRLTTALRGPEHPDTADTLVILGQCIAASSPRQALVHLEHAMAIRRVADPAAPHLGNAALVAARVHLALGAPALARPLLEAAVREADPKEVLAVEAGTELGRTLAALHDDVAAAVALERAVQLAATREGNPIERGRAHLELARHLGERLHPPDRARAAALLETAGAAFSSAVPADAGGLAEIKRLRLAWGP